MSDIRKFFSATGHEPPAKRPKLGGSSADPGLNTDQQGGDAAAISAAEHEGAGEGSFNCLAWADCFNAVGANKRQLRIEIAQGTEEACRSWGYSHPTEGWVRLPKAFTTAMTKATQSYSNNHAALSVAWEPRYLAETTIEVVNADCLDAAAVLRSKGYNPVILNMANARTPGGGWRSGAGAQEESLFRRTNYLHSLIDPQLLGSGKRYPIAEFGGIYSPGVLSFRSNEEAGYCFMPAPQPYSFIASAAINRPRLVHASHGKKRLEPRDASKTKRKIAAVLSIGLDHGHDSIVLSAFGCGAFKNPPEHIAEIFKELLVADPGSAYTSTGTAGRRGGTWHTAFEGCYKRVVFAILDDSNAGCSHNANGNLAPFAQKFGQPVSLTTLGDRPSAMLVAPAASSGQQEATASDCARKVADEQGHAQATSAGRHEAHSAGLQPATDTIAALHAAKKWSAGLVPYRNSQHGEVEVLLGHMGGPFWKSKQRAWSILKGEPAANQQPADAFAVAVREWEEESGLPAPSDTSLYIDLGIAKQTSKTVAAWCFKSNCNPSTMHSNTWTDQHGRSFPEIDEYRWVAIDDVLRSGILIKAQEQLVERVKQLVATRVDTASGDANTATATGTGGGDASSGGSGTRDGFMVIDGGRVFRGVTLPERWRAVAEDMAVWQSNPPPGPLPLRSWKNETKSRGGEVLPKQTVAAFDFDDCVAVCGYGGKAWTGEAKDWRMKFAHVPQVLRHLHDSGYLVAVLSNESTARLKKEDAIRKALDRKCGRIEAWAAEVAVPMICCVALSGTSAAPGKFRKPSVGMWTWLEQAAVAATGSTGNRLELDKSRSFFVGDAAGRHGDHSAVDLEFAAGVGVRFYTETEFFGRGTHGGKLLLPPDVIL